ncbi:MAG: FAD-binding oxidoreductase [Burkholderiales bacterium]
MDPAGEAGALVARLSAIVGSSAVLVEDADLAGYVEDWRGVYRGTARCVVLPATTEQVSAVVRACVEAGVPVVPQGGNTGLCGGSVPPAGGEGAVVLALSRMRRIRDVDPANNAIEVEAGCVLRTVQEAAAAAGRLYPVSLGAEGSCQIGGTIATNAGGTGVLRYGSTRDNVLGLEVVLPDGEVWNGLNRLRKNNTGPDLKHLFIGSEGTLGVITAATLKLHPLPTSRCVAWLAVRSPADALGVLLRFQSSCGAWLSAFEMLNAAAVDKVLRQLPDRRVPLDAAYPWHVLVELEHSGSEPALAQAMEEALGAAASAGLVDDAAIAGSVAQQEAMWMVRHSVSEAFKRDGVSVSMDTAVPVAAVPEFIGRASAAAREIVPDVEILVVSHVGDGNVHFIPFVSFDRWREREDRDALDARLRDRVNRIAHGLGGTFSAEHGVGQTHTREMALFRPAVELALLRGIKRALDPAGLFNPGRLLPPGTR